MSNSIEYILTIFGVFMAGGIANPINPLLKRQELAPILEDAQPTMIITEDNFYENINETDFVKSNYPLIISTGDYNINNRIAFETLLLLDNESTLEDTSIIFNESDICLLAYSSGTTGSPKGILHTHKSILSQSVASVRHFRFTEKDSILYTLPLYHLFGLNVIFFSGFLVGAKQYIHSKFNTKKVIEELNQTCANVFAGVPTMYKYLCSYCQDNKISLPINNLEFAIVAGSPIEESIIRKFESIFNTKVLNAYGISEAAGVICAHRRDLREVPITSVGTPFPKTTIKILTKTGEIAKSEEFGEIIVSSEYLMKCYRGKQKETQKALKNGFLHTGDIGYFDKNGNLYVMDRIKDIILSGGYTIFPTEIEKIVNNNPLVEECVVFPIKDIYKGEIPGLAVVLKEKSFSNEHALNEIYSYCKENIASYKCPTEIII
jgi:long-chain acyl-CoA synthetase